MQLWLQELLAVGVWNLFDVARSRLMNSSVKDGKYRNMMDCFAKTYRAEGALALWKGFWPTMLVLAREL